MIPDEIVRRRLAFIKYLYNIAVEQSQRPEPLCSASILTFHDAVELFLQLVSEHFNVSKKYINFLDYWDVLTPQLLGNSLTQKASMERLNKARVALKHHGIMPSKLDIEAFRASTTNFFEENTEIAFDIRFADISLVELVQCEDAKNNLKEAEKMLKENKKIEDILDKVAVAFHQIIYDYESRTKDRFGRSPFSFGKLNNLSSGVKNSIETLQNAVKILSLGIDYRRYSKFTSLTPIVHRVLSGNYYTYSLAYSFQSNIKRTPEDAWFCINFVIETAVTLQQF